MILKKLLEGIDYQTNISDIDKRFIKNITTDSRNLKPGDIFICITGSRFDGHEFARASLLLKTSEDIVVISQKDLGIRNQVIVEDTRKAYAKISANYFDNPADKLKLIGVTGTNGKTSTTYIIKHILENLGKKVGLIGTIQNEIEDMAFVAKYTTPDPLELNVLFKKMVDCGCEYVVMEISSHALDQERVFGLNFKVAVFTNLTQDHLDYHGTMENYFQAKKKLFDMCESAVVNIDSKSGERLFENIKSFKTSYAVDKKADIYSESVLVSKNGTSFKLAIESKTYDMNINMLGKFFVANSIAAVSVAKILGFETNKILESLKICKGVKGRAEILPVKADFTVIRDYAHGPDGIEKILDAINQFATGRVVILFGCAGRRDRTKRKIMADIAAKKSDYVILTSDNPRDEDPNIIIKDALEGLEKNNTPYKIIIDRYQAIKWALENSQKNDILVLAGKGHEDYQVLDFGTIYFDEYQIVSEILNK
ncbi:MAG: UDP-N-acetylmuramoyl-L-alanyl-D-glutamate--2,6-diaminopimelate ligase [Oscillospiraceae bacterium]|nr:UDP-N-acetylmuramoyl-L-alanyl-D-glutamate--2,6-diaminopimelate ligase [Oscillospiraceae bacterium]